MRAAAIGLLLLATLAASEPEVPRVVRVIADKDNRFKLPDEPRHQLVVRAKEKLVFRIEAHYGGEKARDGSVHGFTIRSLREQGWDVRLKEGMQDVALTAPETPGEYVIECTVKCGSGHEDMNFKMLVRP